MQENNTQRDNSILLPSAIIIVGVLIAGAIIWSSSGGRVIQQAPVANTPEASQEIVFDVEGWPYIGEENAPVVIVEYSDFACPHCRAFWNDTLSQIKENYIDKGIVRFVYKDFPVVGGEKAAEASHCAEEQGAYWEYNDLLFSRQTEDRATWTDVEVHKGYAEELGLDAEAMAECFNSEKYKDKISQSTTEAMNNGGSGTPFFLVGGVPLNGNQPYASFQAAIDAANNN